jgi:hypothetical protein
MLPASVTSIMRAWLKGQRRKYWIRRWTPSWSPASRRTLWSTLNLECLKLLPTLGAAQPGEAVLEIATVEEFADHRPNDWPPIARALLVTLLVDRLKLRIEPLDQFVKASWLAFWLRSTRSSPMAPSINCHSQTCF